MMNTSPKMIDAETDARFMAAALAYGRRGLGLTAPNPSVGALVVRDGVVVGRGVTAPTGRPHAEIEALRDAGEAARGATMYVTLEPCNHHGKSPPCAEAIVEAGIGRVVYALKDPDLRVDGSGHARLLAAGIPVTAGILEDEALRSHRGHVLRVKRGRPMVTLKLAQTADGYAAGALHDGRLPITGAQANALTHVTRALHDAIMVGRGTAADDDPLMTVRLPGLENRKPVRVILDSNLSLSPTSRLAQTARDWPTLVIGTQAGAAATQPRANVLTDLGIELAFVEADADGHCALPAVLAALAARGLTRVFSEGGPRVGTALIEARLADEVMVFTAAKPLGFEGTPALASGARRTLADTDVYRRLDERLVGTDRLTHYEAIG